MSYRAWIMTNLEKVDMTDLMTLTCHDLNGVDLALGLVLLTWTSPNVADDMAEMSILRGGI